MGTDFDPQSFPWSGKLVVFENIGYDENNEPEWELIDDQYLGNDLGNNFKSKNLASILRTFTFSCFLNFFDNNSLK